MSALDLLSLGAGVQSSTLGLMASEGFVRPMPQAGIFSDTQDEPQSVYRWLAYLEPKLAFPIHRVTAGKLSTDALRIRKRKDGKGSWVPSGIPHFSINADGSKGQGPRQCTHDFKLIPIIKKQRELAGAAAMLKWRRSHKAALVLISAHEKAVALWKRLKKQGVDSPIPERPNAAWDECQADPLVICWIGISTDESSRVKPSRLPWVRNRYPLIELGASRKDCVKWMDSRGHPKAPRSACKFCPYHSDDEWIRLRDEEPEEFKQAVEFDYAYRAAKIQTVSPKGFQPFIHDSRVPLDKVVFVASGLERQLSLFNDECEGMCGV